MQNLHLSSTNNSNGNNLIPFRRQFIINNGEDRLVTRASSDTINVNNTDPLDIDQASLDVIVDKQVRLIEKEVKVCKFINLMIMIISII